METFQKKSLPKIAGSVSKIIIDIGNFVKKQIRKVRNLRFSR